MANTNMKWVAIGGIAGGLTVGLVPAITFAVLHNKNESPKTAESTQSPKENKAKQKEIEAKQKEIEAKQKEIEAKQKEIDKLKQDIKNNPNQASMDAKQKEIEAKQKEIDKLKQDIKKLPTQADLDAKQKEIDKLKQDVKNLTPRVKFNDAPTEMNITNVDWDGAFVYKDSIAATKQYVATKSGVFEYDATTPDEFTKIDEFDGIGDMTGGFMFAVSELAGESYIFIGTKTGLYVVHRDDVKQEIIPNSKQLIASGDYTNTNMIDKDVSSGKVAYIYDKKGSLLKLKLNAQTTKWEFDKTSVIKNLPTKYTGIKTLRYNEDDNGVMYFYGDEGITAISFNDSETTDIKKITSKPVQSMNILTKKVDFENIDGTEDNFKLGIVFKDSIGFMNPIANDLVLTPGEWLKNIPTIKEIKVEGDLTDAKVAFIKEKSVMTPTLITKTGIKILVGNEWVDSLKQDGTKETTDFTKSMIFDASSFTAMVNGKELKNIEITKPKTTAYTATINNIY